MKVAVVTGGRADYGLLRPTLLALRDDSRFSLALVVAAMHLRAEHGDTLAAIAEDGLTVDARVATGERTEAAGDWGANLAAGIAGFTDALEGLAPDVLLVLGDRHEVLAAALAATGLGLPIAHLHGGELSEGSLDDAMRHCVTKLAHVHLAATREYAERICQLGEDPARVHVVGAAGIESIRSLPLLDRDELARQLELSELRPPIVALTFHPASVDPGAAGEQAAAVAEALAEVLAGDGTAIITLPNDDPGNVSARQALVAAAREHPNFHAYPALGQLRYLSLLRHADAVVGNSSSAIIEAPEFRVPVINVGDRQRGRAMWDGIVTTAPERNAIGEALRRALEPGYRERVARLESPYEGHDTSARVLAILASLPPAPDLRRKRFHDLPDGPWRSALQFDGAQR
jgi:UDP-hydrolysing UDP-N-acetyl-D-glucosamine 2-epimerase